MENEFINPEQMPMPEGGKDKQIETKTEVATEKVIEKNGENAKPLKSQPAPKAEPVVQSMPAAKNPRVQEIENILSTGLTDYYMKLNPADQQKFKESGEQAAQEVDNILQKAIVKIEEVIGIIKQWLGTVPGLNKFFIEQSAKIKADKIMLSKRK